MYRRVGLSVLERCCTRAFLSWYACKGTTNLRKPKSQDGPLTDQINEVVTDPDIARHSVNTGQTLQD